MRHQQIEHFRVLYRTRNITKAAQTLFLSRQALSNSIQSIERELGTTLFIRNKYGVEPTEAGRLFYEYANEESELWDQMLSQISGQDAIRVIRFGTPLLGQNPDYTQAVFSFQEQYPLVHISVIEGNGYTKFFELLREYKIDVAKTANPPAGSDLAWKRLKKYAVVLLVGTNTPLADMPVINYETDLRGQTLLLQSSDYMHELEMYKVDAGVTYELIEPNAMLIKEIVASGRAVFAIPESYTYELTDERIAVKQLENFPLVIYHYLIYRTDSDQIIHKFVNHLVSIDDLLLTQN